MTLTDEPVTETRRGAHLKPFDSESARIAAQRSAEARRARKELARNEHANISTQLRRVREAYKREELGPNAAAMAQHLMSQVITGQIPVRNGAEAAELIRCGVDIARLEAGQNTSQTAHIAMSAAEVQARLADLHQRIIPAQSPVLELPE